MSDAKLRILIAGIKIKLVRGESLEDILATYVNLTEEEKKAIIETFKPTPVRVPESPETE